MIDVSPAPVARVAPPVRPVAMPSAESMVAAITPKPQRGDNRKTKSRKFTDEQLLEAVAEHGHDNVAIAALFKVTKSVVNMHRRRLGVPSPKGARPRHTAAKTAVQDWPMADVRWNDENVAKLRTMATQDPRLPTEEIARAFGTSIIAIQTALSRFDITKGGAGNQPKNLSGPTQRKCMSCQKPFMSEGIHNRRCSNCKSNDHRIAA